MTEENQKDRISSQSNIQNICIWQSLNTMFLLYSLNIMINVFILSDEYINQIT